MSYQYAVNVSEFIANKHDDSDSAEDDHLYLARPPTVSCYGLPYLDHTYGAPWPSSPPPPVPAAPAQQPRINGHIDIDNVSYHAEVCTTSNDPDNQYADSVTRCICGFLHDDGYMICCDKCGVWQHVDCMGVEREHIPEMYLCEVCQPRHVDRRKAMLIQRKRYELLTAVDVEAVDMSDDSNPLPLARDLNNLVPLRPGHKPQQKRFKVLKRSLSMTSGLKPLHRHLKYHRLPRKPLVNGPSVTTKVNLSPRLASIKSVADDFTDDDHYHNKSGRREDEVNVVELSGHRNSYSSEVAGLLRRQQRQNGQQQHPQHSVGDMLAPLRDQLCRIMHVGPNIKGLQVLDDIETSRPLIEYTGSVRVDDDATDDSVSSKRLHPFVLIYSKFASTQLRIESGSADTDAKYVRRSCKPNAEIRHVSDNSTLRFFVFSSRPIFRGQEITIPFDMEYTESDSFVCGCGRVPCPVLKSTAKFSRLGRRRKSERENVNANADLNGEDVKPVVTGRRRQREDSCLDNAADVRLSASDGAIFISAAAVNKRRGSDESLSSTRASLAACRRKRSSCVQEEETSEDEAVVNVEETGRRQSLGDRTRRMDRKRHASGSDRAKFNSSDGDEKKPKVTLEHSVSCTSPKDGEDDGRKMSREERKLEAIMKAFERMEKQTVKRRDSVSKTDSPRTSDKAEVKAEIKEEVEDVKPSVRFKKGIDIRKPAAKKLKGRRRSWLTMKRESRKSSNVSSQSSSTSLDGARISASVPCTPVASDRRSAPFKFPKTKKAMMSEWQQEKATGMDGRPRGDDYRRSLTVDTSEDDDTDKYVNYIQTPSRHADALKNVRRTSTSSGSSKGSPASLHHLQQQAEFGAGSAKKRWLRQVMHEKKDGDDLNNGPVSPGDNSASPSTPSVAASSELVAPLKKRRMARESTSEEAATLLSLANSVPAMEYEQLEHSRAAGTSSEGQVLLAEQLLALQASVVSTDNTDVVDVLASTSSAACSVDVKVDGFRLLLEGIEQAAARERANSMQASPPISSASSLPIVSPPVASSALLVVAVSDEDGAVAAAVNGCQSADDGCSLSCDSSVVLATAHTARCSNSERDIVEVGSSVELTVDTSAEPLLHSTSDILQWPVDSVVSSNVSGGCSVAGSSSGHLDGIEETVSCSEEVNHLSDLDPDCSVSSSRRFFTVGSDYSNEAASSDILGSQSIVRGNLLTFRQAATASVDDADVSSSGVGSASWHECSSAVSSSHACVSERKKVSLLEYRNRMRGRSSSSCGSNVLLSPRSDSGTTSAAVAEATPDTDVSENSSSATVRERRESADVRWSAEATAAERVREQCHGHRSLTDRLHHNVSDDDVDSKPADEAGYDVNLASIPASSISQHHLSVSTVYPRSTPSSGIQHAALPSLASSAPVTLPLPPTGDSGMPSEARSAADQPLAVTTCLTVHTAPADHSLTNGQLYDDLSPSTSQPLTNSGSGVVSTAHAADEPPSLVLPHDQCAAALSSSHV